MLYVLLLTTLLHNLYSRHMKLFKVKKVLLKGESMKCMKYACLWLDDFHVTDGLMFVAAVTKDTGDDALVVAGDFQVMEGLLT